MLLKLKEKKNLALKKEISLMNWTAIFLSLIFLRVFIEQFLSHARPRAFYSLFIEYSHDIYFFGITFLFLWILTSFLTKKNPCELSFIFLLGSWLILLPPVLDMIRTQGSVFWSFYILSDFGNLSSHFFTFFGNLPSGIVYFGTKITFFLAIIFLSIFIFFETKNKLCALISFLFFYIILFFMGAFPTFFFIGHTFFSASQKVTEIKAYQIAQFFGSSQKILGVASQNLTYNFASNLNLIFFPLLIFMLIIFSFFWDKKKLFAVFFNLRFPQMIYHSGLFLIGIGLGTVDFSQNFSFTIFSLMAILCLLLVVWLAWTASVIVNDIYDFEIDCVSNPDRPLVQKIFTVKEYFSLGIFCFLLSILGASSVGFSFAGLIIVYQILAYFYSAPPFRLKKFPLFATFLSSSASLMILFLGYILLSDDQTIRHLSWRIILLLWITYTFSLPIKDFKDIEGDKKYRIWTIPVILGEKKARLMVAINIFVSYMLSVFLLNEMRLFIWALIFGTASFLTVTSLKVKPRQLFWPILGLVALYTFILVRIIFL